MKSVSHAPPDDLQVPDETDNERLSAKRELMTEQVNDPYFREVNTVGKMGSGYA